MTLAAAKELRERLRGTGIEVMEGPEGLTAAATLPEADTVVTAVMGSVGLGTDAGGHHGEKAHRPGQQGDAGVRR